MPPSPPLSPDSTATTLPPISTMVEAPLKTTVNILESLTAFYQQERMWVYRTRASLEEPSEVVDMDTDSLSESSSSSSPSVEADSAAVKTEYIPVSHSSPPPSPSLKPSERRHKLKKNIKLQLIGIPSNLRLPLASRDTAVSRADPGVQILEMYESMMESRMESCQRINRLVKNANRADLKGVVRRKDFLSSRASLARSRDEDRLNPILLR